ncbi:zinc-regulated transporter 2 [Podospora fimiseda]|uniref:Zinc-regulated transporter 2 n=1 Tax=Podospora fimiseda TaxID=252190 RepID=A0AAN7H844_9PEZI|nr:zinc-regulated transporter 2 [Podospora fimiseda]
METLNLRSNDLLWSQIPTSLLLAELNKRDASNNADDRPACGSGKTEHPYDTGLHVFALFLILIVSTLACGFPLFSQRLTKGSSSRTQRTIIFLCQHFGTGVLMATAFVHLLPTAFISLTDPCLPYMFRRGFRPLAGLIAMVAALVVCALESYLSTRGASHSHGHSHSWDDDSEEEEDTRHRHGEANIALQNLESRDNERQGLVLGASPLPGSTPTTTRPNTSDGTVGESLLKHQQRDSAESDRESMDLEFSLQEMNGNGNGNASQSRPLNRGNGNKSLTSKPLPALPNIQQKPNPEEQKRMMLQCVLLEAGILFHSVFIGMALSVATGPTFVVFLIAISFHQSFEGIALGTRIAALHFPKSSPRPWLMVLAFGATTPIGQAIGLVIHTFYDPMSQTGLLMVGFMNAISSGLLLFAGLVQLLAEDFLSEKSYKTLKGKKRIHAFLAVCGGAFLMSAVGAFA